MNTPGNKEADAPTKAAGTVSSSSPRSHVRTGETDPDGLAIDGVLEKLDRMRWTVPDAEVPVTDGHKRAAFAAVAITPPAPRSEEKPELVIVREGADDPRSTQVLRPATPGARRKGFVPLVGLAILLLLGVLAWVTLHEEGTPAKMPLAKSSPSSSSTESPPKLPSEAVALPELSSSSPPTAPVMNSPRTAAEGAEREQHAPSAPKRGALPRVAPAAAIPPKASEPTPSPESDLPFETPKERRRARPVEPVAP